MALTADRIGSRYGVLPTDVLRQPPRDFWTNARIMNRGIAWENDQKRKQNRNQTSAGVASAGEKEQLVEDQEARADRREQLQDQGGPSLDDKLDALNDMNGSDPSGPATGA